MYSYIYPRLAITVDAVVFTNVNSMFYVLLIRRGQEPFKGKWALPGGFAGVDELLQTACIRELEEETGLQVKKMKQYRTYDAIDRDPRHRTISVVYSAEIKDKQPVKGSDDAAQAHWFPVKNLPDLAFDHQQILDDFFNQ
jgi:8-oxo-dGTP diphosphatase